MISRCVHLLVCAREDISKPEIESQWERGSLCGNYVVNNKVTQPQYGSVYGLQSLLTNMLLVFGVYEYLMEEQNILQKMSAPDRQIFWWSNSESCCHDTIIANYCVLFFSNFGFAVHFFRLPR